MSLDHAILGFLNYSPMTGYDLKKSFDRSVAHFWSATQSHIYKSLERLQNEGFLTVESVPQEKRPNRKLYKITTEGAEELSRWLAAPLPLEQIRLDWLIQVFFAAYLPDDEIDHMIRARMAAVRGQLDYYRNEVRPNIEKAAAFVGDARISDCWHLTLDTGIALRQAELDLLERTLQRRKRS